MIFKEYRAISIKGDLYTVLLKVVLIVDTPYDLYSVFFTALWICPFTIWDVEC